MEGLMDKQDGINNDGGVFYVLQVAQLTNKLLRSM